MSNANRILVTGASGVIGRKLVARLVADGHRLNLAGRTDKCWFEGGDVIFFGVGSVGAQTDWREALKDCDRVVHLAAQVPLAGVTGEVLTEVNDRGSKRLAEQIGASDVELLISMSTVFALCEETKGNPVDDNTHPNPASQYGKSKREAEKHVLGLTELDKTVVVLRAPLVYGGDAQGNWRLLQRLAASKVPLPFASIDNRRTLVSLDNLVDGVAHLLTIPIEKRTSGSFMIADNEAVSLRQIIMWLRAGMNVPSHLFPVPKSVMAGALRLLGKDKVRQSLFGDLEIDSSGFQETFAWMPTEQAKEAIMKSGLDFIGSEDSALPNRSEH